MRRVMNMDTAEIRNMAKNLNEETNKFFEKMGNILRRRPAWTPAVSVFLDKGFYSNWDFWGLRGLLFYSVTAVKSIKFVLIETCWLKPEPKIDKTLTSAMARTNGLQLVS